MLGIRHGLVVVTLFCCLCPATNPAKVKSEKQAANVFKTNPEGKLVIREETEEEREELGGDRGQEIEDDEEMDIDEVILSVPVNYNLNVP